jgi:hypothetical protein
LVYYTCATTWILSHFQGYPPLVFSLLCENVQAAELFLSLDDSGIDLNAISKPAGLSALMAAVVTGNVDAAKGLLDRSVQVDLKNDEVCMWGV